MLKWIIDRCHGRVGATETPLGWFPRTQDFDLEGLENFGPADFEKIQNISIEEWRREIISQDELFIRLYSYLPKEMISSGSCSWRGFNRRSGTQHLNLGTQSTQGLQQSMNCGSLLLRAIGEAHIQGRHLGADRAELEPSARETTDHAGNDRDASKRLDRRDQAGAAVAFLRDLRHRAEGREESLEQKVIIPVVGSGIGHQPLLLQTREADKRSARQRMRRGHSHAHGILKQGLVDQTLGGLLLGADQQGDMKASL